MIEVALWVMVVLASFYLIFQVICRVYGIVFSSRFIKVFKKDPFGWHSFEAIQKGTNAPDWYLIAILKRLLEDQALFKQLNKTEYFEIDDFLTQHENVLTLHNYEFKLNPNKPRGKKRKINIFLDLPDLWPESITARAITL